MAVSARNFFSDCFNAHAADARRCPREILVDKFFIQSNGFKNLCAAVALDGGDAHFGKHFHDAFRGGFYILLDRRRMIDIRQKAFADHVIEGFQSEVRIHRTDTVADEKGKVMDFARLAGFEHEAHAGAGALCG